MAITLVPEPTTGAPITASDYSYQNGLISANEVPDLAFLTDWELTASEPLIKKGVYIYHAGNTYIVDTADEAISGSPSAGTNYIELTLSGSTITAAWVTATTGYTFNPAYGGVYNGTGEQLLPDICYLDGTDYIRGRCFGMDYNFIHLADGNFLMSSGIDTQGANITTSGGDFTVDGGIVDLSSGELEIDNDAFPSAPSSGSTSITYLGTWVVPSGIHFISISPSANCTINVEWYSGTWDLKHRFPNISTDQAITLPSDGTNTRIGFSSGSGTLTIRWVKC